MKPLTYFNVAEKQITSHRGSVVKIETKVNDAGGDTLFIQVHDTAVLPSAGAVPLKSWPTSGSLQDYKEFKTGELYLSKGLYLAISSTEATLTVGTGSDKFSALSVELYDPEVPASSTVVGDESTNRTSRVIWATAAGPKRLFEIVINDAAAVLVGEVGAVPTYAAIFAHDNVPGATEKGLLLIPVTLGIRNVFNFGLDGRDVQEVIGGVRYKGCRVALLSVAAGTTPTYANLLTTGCPIKGEYV